MKVNSSRKRSGELFMVSNPPEEFADIILFYQKQVDSFLLIKDESFLKNKDYYFRSYYKERFLFNRSYEESKPDYGRMIILDNLFDNRSIEASHSDDLFITIYFKEDDFGNNNTPLVPYLYIHKMNLYYFPKGLKNNTSIHWEKRTEKMGDYNYKVIRF
ncbi:hypothetical protein HNQ02_003647 [Flavobacterium sp. 7E]|uniref:hypothetical protein n=1 Tax=Flavobacterium sp. 7E TaxID=2735898 RepID=UPI00156E0F00|nr:hypothetical protein [Flavobacterium sp. 7E]NRS90700.1 hypothetical protein [Flavobacterium sp. 7E]